MNVVYVNEYQPSCASVALGNSVYRQSSDCENVHVSGVGIIIPRSLLELGGIVSGLAAAVADINEQKKPAIVLTFASTLMFLMSLWSPGESLAKLPSLRK